MPGVAVRVFWLLAILAYAQGGSASPITVVANVPGIDFLTRRDVEEIVRGERRNWPDGTPIRVILPARSAPSYRRFNQLFFAFGSKDLHRHWVGVVFSGRAAPPKYADSQIDALDVVSRTPGGLTILVSPLVADIDNLSNKVIP